MPVPYKQTINGTAYWVARLGRGLAGGKEQKHYFSERREAKDFPDRMNHGGSLLGMDFRLDFSRAGRAPSG